jgi:hypothetical protein
MIFRKGTLRKNVIFTYMEKKIEIVQHFTYLGIVFTTGGSFNGTFISLTGQAMKAIFKLKSCFTRFPTMSISHKLDLFDKLIAPVLSYGSEVWGLNKNIIQIERIHLKFCKELLGVRSQTQNNFVYGELGRTPLKNKFYINVIK